MLGHGLANPGALLDAYVSLATSANDADQRALGAAIGQRNGLRCARAVADRESSAPKIQIPERRPQ